MKHTPTPWKFTLKNSLYGKIINEELGIVIVENLFDNQTIRSVEESDANGKHIVHAVNMHELLLATLKQAVESLDEFGCEDIVYYKDIIEKAGRK